MNRFFLYLTLFITFSFAACKRQQVYKGEAGRETDAKVAVEEVEFDYFSSKAKVDYKSGNSSLGFTASIRMQKDSVIWLSASPALGIEAARVMITPDSVKIINRLNKTYERYSIDYLKKNFNADLSFSEIQDLLVGNLVVPAKKGEKLNNVEDSDCVILVAKNGNLKISNLISRERKKVTGLVVEEASGSELTVDYEEFEPLADFIFPYTNVINASVKGKGNDRNVQIRIEHKNAEISEEPLNFAFNVPSKYECK